jgi:predicted dehydrogenase
MSGRHDMTAMLLDALHRDPAVFGAQLPGSAAEPGIEMASVHHLLKQVAGLPNPRPAWFFDIAEQGGSLVDIATHLVDRVQRTLCPDTPLDLATDIRIEDARHWSTSVSLAQFRQVTGEAVWPDAVAPSIVGDQLAYLCNGRLDYALRGVRVRLDMAWHWEAPPGAGDSHHTVIRGTRARLEVRQAGADRRELFVVPHADIGAALAQRIAALQTLCAGVGIEAQGTEWRITVPDRHRLGHDGQFVALMRRVLEGVAARDRWPAWEPANLRTKYSLTTAALALAERSG